MTPHSLVPITDIKPGAELAEALRDAGGALLRAGSARGTAGGGA